MREARRGCPHPPLTIRGVKLATAGGYDIDWAGGAPSGGPAGGPLV